MIQYNPKEWFSFIFRFHKADTVRKLMPLIIANSVYAGIVAFIELEVLKLEKSSHLVNLTMVHSLLGLVISLLLVFRTNTAYERWWEGRKHWGSLVNTSRSMAIKLNALLPADAKAERDFFRVAIPNFSFALKNHLRGKLLRQEWETNAFFSEGSIRDNEHVPNQFAALMMNRLAGLQQKGVLLPEHLVLLNPELQNFTDVCGACERIKKTPIPFSYSTFLKKFIFFYIMTLPIGYVFSLGYWIIPVVAFFFYVLASLELIAEEIEDPFGTDANDLPTDEIANVIRNSVKDILK
jgi:ion channel-forming bestrophin family protein